MRSRMPGGVEGVAGAILPSRPDSPWLVVVAVMQEDCREMDGSCEGCGNMIEQK